MPLHRRLDVSIDRFPIAGHFTIARGSRNEAIVVTATITDGEIIGRGECVPYARYGETVEGVAEAITAMRTSVSSGMDRQELQKLMPAGAARNALDCAMWDLEAKKSGIRAQVSAGVGRLMPTTTAFTLSLDTAEAMGKAAQAASHRAILKIKLGGQQGDFERLRAVRHGAPDATLIVDANEGWTGEALPKYLDACVEAGVALIEQPLPAGAEEALLHVRKDIPICADESLHDRKDLPRIARYYDAINIKLDKTGGLTEALSLVREAHTLGLIIMVGCMVGTSLSMAPALLLTPFARFVDLDGPLLLAQDREHGLTYDGSIVYPPEADLWG